ncbi:hypothetical protein KOR42_11610 [Thalassoglobus neptunius]|uniref:Uncharacterized protein n=1 Tax=Thalassoglobus neptunius TaxID=1938619 RepID=A0A5C5X489_9PLAN|nr:hypothetical protein KOR42_11610 [Thalassoglobus neptunius]
MTTTSHHLGAFFHLLIWNGSRLVTVDERSRPSDNSWPVRVHQQPNRFFRQAHNLAELSSNIPISELIRASLARLSKLQSVSPGNHISSGNSVRNPPHSDVRIGVVAQFAVFRFSWSFSPKGKQTKCEYLPGRKSIRISEVKT